MKRYFQYLNPFFVLIFRLGLGKFTSSWPEVGGQVLILIHQGRKSGRIYRTPAHFAIVDGEIYGTVFLAQNNDWYRNLRANPKAEVWLPEEWWQVDVEEADSHPERTALMRAVLMSSGFAAQAVGIDAYTISDGDLDEITKDYRLFHLRKIAPRTGAGGPSDLAWVWPLGVLVLLPMALRGRRKRCGK